MNNAPCHLLPCSAPHSRQLATSGSDAYTLADSEVGGDLVASPQPLKTDVREVGGGPHRWHLWEAPGRPGALGGRLPHAPGGARTAA